LSNNPEERRCHT